VLSLFAVASAGSDYAFIGDKFPVVVAHPRERVQELASIIDGHFSGSRSKTSVEVLVNKKGLAELRAANFDVTVVSPVPLPQKDFIEYHDYEELTEFLEEYNARYPNISRIFTLGESVAGRELWGMQISDNPAATEALEPEFGWFGNIHGDETVGREMLIELIAYLLDGYGQNQAITNLVDTTNIFIVPSINPDGFEATRRSNNNGYDLNRDFPDQFQDDNNTPNGREPETQAVMRFTNGRHFVLSANLHGGAVCVNYPWDGFAQQTQCGRAASLMDDDDVIVEISLGYSILNPPMYASREFNDGITNGAEWYCVYGGLQDWTIVYNHNFHVTIELSNVKNPAASELDGFWDDNQDAMMAYMNSAHIGIKGIISNEANGNPISGASINVQGRSDFTVNSDSTGSYYRLLLPGSYQVTASAPGFSPSTQTVNVVRGQATLVNFAL